MEKVEILAPAGTMESLVAAINKGADAVYLGGNKFSARAYASNFDNDNMLKSVDYAHSYDVKIYVTLNTILKENEIPATFFLQGQCLAGNEEIVRRMHAEGHLIGNHTFHHVQLTKVSEEEAREEVVKTSNAIYEITGEYPV